MHSVIVCSIGPDPVKPDSPVSKTGGSRISKIMDESNKAMMADPDDWKTPLARYLENIGYIADRKVWHEALKYVMLDNSLYHWNIDGLLLKCLGSDQSKIAMEGGGGSWRYLWYPSVST
jgi:hypothetical protein